jgi:hypothetical protein
LAVGPFGGPVMAGGSTRDFAIPQSPCGIPAGVQAYSLNVTVVPRGWMGYLAIWPAGQSQPVVSTLNAFDGRTRANAAIVPAGIDGAVSVYVTDTTDVILDINGYFVPASTVETLAFYPLAPCRVADTRLPAGPFGGPVLGGGTARTIPVLSSACGVPAGARAYSLNFTAVPRGRLGYLATWPAGTPQPVVSTLNAPTGAVTANAAIVPAGTGGAIDVLATNDTDLVIDINGYFAAPGGIGALSFYGLTPCRVADTRNPPGPFGQPAMSGARDFPVPASACSVPAGASAYSMNATVVPHRVLGFLALWPAGSPRPVVSTLNSFDGSVVANAAIVPAGSSGFISAYVSDAAELILDINGYFAP